MFVFVSERSTIRFEPDAGQLPVSAVVMGEYGGMEGGTARMRYSYPLPQDARDLIARHLDGGEVDVYVVLEYHVPAREVEEFAAAQGWRTRMERERGPFGRDRRDLVVLYGGLRYMENTVYVAEYRFVNADEDTAPDDPVVCTTYLRVRSLADLVHLPPQEV